MAYVGVRRRRKLRRDMYAEVLQEADEVAAPAGGDGGRAESVFQDEIPADDPGEEFAQGRVAVGVSRTRDGDQRGEFGIAQAGEDTAQSGQHEGQYDRRTCILSGRRSGEHKNSGADDSADTQSNEVYGAQGPLQTMFTGLGRLTRQHVEGLAFQQISHSGCASSSRLFLCTQLPVAVRP